jgi:hypothetical protein
MPSILTRPPSPGAGVRARRRLRTQRLAARSGSPLVVLNERVLT